MSLLSLLGEAEVRREKKVRGDLTFVRGMSVGNSTPSALSSLFSSSVRTRVGAFLPEEDCPATSIPLPFSPTSVGDTEIKCPLPS